MRNRKMYHRKYKATAVAISGVSANIRGESKDSIEGADRKTRFEKRAAARKAVKKSTNNCAIRTVAGTLIIKVD